MRIVSRSRTLDGDGQFMRPTGLDERGDVIDPRLLVEVGCKKPAGIIVEKRVDPDYVAARR